MDLETSKKKKKAKSTPNKKAVLIGLKHPNPEMNPIDIKGQILRMKNHLMERRGFSEDNIILITEDDDDEKHLQPTAVNIREQLYEMVECAYPGDILFIHLIAYGCSDGYILTPDKKHISGDILHRLRRNLHDPNNVLQSWDPKLPNPCTWFHVTCNGYNSVVRIDLGDATLSGQLVPQLGQLKNLQYLELFSNSITGHIPNDLGNLTNLVSLDLYLNRFTGHIPDSLGKLSKLRFLDLSNNRPSGLVPNNGSYSLFTPTSFANYLDLSGCEHFPCNGH